MTTYAEGHMAVWLALEVELSRVGSTETNREGVYGY